MFPLFVLLLSLLIMMYTFKKKTAEGKMTVFCPRNRNMTSQPRALFVLIYNFKTVEYGPLTNLTCHSLQINTMIPNIIINANASCRLIARPGHSEPPPLVRRLWPPPSPNVPPLCIQKLKLLTLVLKVLIFFPKLLLPPSNSSFLSTGKTNWYV